MFITSVHRSGSTLLNLVLGSHPQAVSVGEFPRIADVIERGKKCTCGAEPFVTCPFWQNVARTTKDKSGWHLFTDIGEHPMTTYNLRGVARKRTQLTAYVGAIARQPTVRRILLACCGHTAVMQETTRNTFDVFDAILDSSESNLIVDAAKDPFRARWMLSARPVECKIIHLIRDGRGVAHSLLGRTRPEAWFTNVSSAAKHWRSRTRRIQKVLETVPRGQKMVVRYEDFCSSPVAVLKRLCGFLGIPYEPQMLEFAAAEHHDVGGNSMRFSDSSEIRLSTSWQNELSVEELAIFERVAGNMNRECGYSRSAV